MHGPACLTVNSLSERLPLVAAFCSPRPTAKPSRPMWSARAFWAGPPLRGAEVHPCLCVSVSPADQKLSAC